MFGQPTGAFADPGEPFRAVVGMRAEALAVWAALVDVHFEWDAGFSHGIGEHQCVFHGHRLVLVGAPDETGRRIVLDLKFGGGFFDQRGWRIGAKKKVFRTLVRKFAHRDDWITKDGEVRARTLALDDICRVRISGFKTGHDHGREVSASGRADDANAMWVDFPFAGARAHEADGAQTVLHFDGIAVTIGAETIFEDETGDALACQPKGVTFSFVGREPGVAAAGTNDHGSAICFFSSGQERGERGDVFIFGAEGAGRFAGPEGDWGIGLHL